MEQVLADRYALEAEIDRGAIGTVWCARDLTTGEAVAVKVLLPETSQDADVVKGLLAEAEILSELNHPSIVRPRDFVANGLRALVMDLVEGPDVRKKLRASGPFRASEAASIGAQIADALAAVHAAGMLHGDVKPGNIMVPSDGGPAKLVDFGVARRVQLPETVTHATLEYVAPEVVAGSAPTPASDVYSMGMVLYEMTCARSPYRGGSVQEVVERHAVCVPVQPAGMPDELWSVVLRCVELDPARRPTAGQLASELRALARTFIGRTAAAPLPENASTYRPRLIDRSAPLGYAMTATAPSHADPTSPTASTSAAPSASSAPLTPAPASSSAAAVAPFLAASAVPAALESGDLENAAGVSPHGFSRSRDEVDTPMGAGSVSAMPMSAGPVSAGPVSGGSVSAGSVSAGPVPGEPVSPGPSGDDGSVLALFDRHEEEPTRVVGAVPPGAAAPGAFRAIPGGFPPPEQSSGKGKAALFIGAAAALLLVLGLGAAFLIWSGIGGPAIVDSAEPNPVPTSQSPTREPSPKASPSEEPKESPSESPDADEPTGDAPAAPPNGGDDGSGDSGDSDGGDGGGNSGGDRPGIGDPMPTMPRR